MGSLFFPLPLRAWWWVVLIGGPADWGWRDQLVEVNRTAWWAGMAVVCLFQSPLTSATSLKRVMVGEPGTPQGRLVLGDPNLQDGSALLPGLSCVPKKALSSLWLCAPQAGSPKCGAIFCSTQRCRVNLIPSYTRNTVDWAWVPWCQTVGQCEHLDGTWRSLSPVNTNTSGSQTQLRSLTIPPTPVAHSSRPTCE